VIENVGILDESFIMYGDDLDWCYRIKQAGWKVWYVPDVQIVHLGGQSSRRLSRKCIVLFYRAMVIFYRKHYAPRHTFIVSLIVYAGIWLRAATALCINALRKEKVVGSKKPCAK
jgi:GT2 family glycosyltransferase